jgi:hypothetical protein
MASTNKTYSLYVSLVSSLFIFISSVWRVGALRKGKGAYSYFMLETMLCFIYPIPIAFLTASILAHGGRLEHSPDTGERLLQSTSPAGWAIVLT